METGVAGIHDAIGTGTVMEEGGEEETREGEDLDPALGQRANLRRKKRPINLLALHPLPLTDLQSRVTRTATYLIRFNDYLL